MNTPDARAADSAVDPASASGLRPSTSRWWSNYRTTEALPQGTGAAANDLVTVRDMNSFITTPV
ncbi:MAG: hypothetical protein ACXVXZ_14395, partial [Mycobacteriaceae bacterium]